MEGQLVVYEAMETRSKATTVKSSSNDKKPNISGSNSHQTSQSKPQSNHRPCPICGADHSVFKCEVIKAKSEADRFAFVKSKDLCTNCLMKHQTSSCPSSKRCFVPNCNQKHHTLLHRKGKSTRSPESPKPENSSTIESANRGTLGNSDRVAGSPSNSLHTHPNSLGSSGGVLLATALISVVGENGLEQRVRALIDPCSQSSFISSSLCQRLQLKTRRVHIPINGTGGNLITTAKRASNITIKSLVHQEFSCMVDVLVLSSISSYVPPTMIPSLKLPHLEGLSLADPQFMKNSHIDVLLGAAVYSRIVEGSVIKGKINEPLATNSALGWLLSGNTPGRSQGTPTTSLHAASEERLDTLLQSFWKQEEVASCSPYTKEEQECEQHFVNTHKRDHTGRFVVRLPFKGGRPSPSLKLGESVYRARSMLLSLERRFEREPNLKKAYAECIKDYETSHHVEVRGPLPEKLANYEGFFLPHHGVLKETSTTTKLRTVFNDSGISLNSLLHASPNLLPHLPDLICCWRNYKFVFFADIEKMLR